MTNHDPRGFLPLTPVAFELLLSLAGEARHGYAILQDIANRTAGEVQPNAGTLYRAIARLVDAGLIAETVERPGPTEDDARRRYYALTSLGRAVVTAEAARLEAAVAVARARNVLPRPGEA
jgi:DNA-binding PadR family transcriptional regulator